MGHGAAEHMFRSALVIEQAQALAEITDEVRAFAAPFGYDRFALFSATAEQDELAAPVYWIEGDWFGDGENVVDAATYVTRCPVTRHIFDAREPFFWTKMAGETGPLYRVVRSPSGPGIHGLQVPVFGPLGLEGAMSFGGKRIDASPQTRLALTWVAGAAFFAARKLLEAPPVLQGTRVLSVREQEVLAWVAAGRRHGDIAVTLGLSERTVENHLRRIRHRLGVATTAQAVRVAIRNGEIGD